MISKLVASSPTAKIRKVPARMEWFVSSVHREPSWQCWGRSLQTASGATTVSWSSCVVCFTFVLTDCLWSIADGDSSQGIQWQITNGQACPAGGPKVIFMCPVRLASESPYRLLMLLLRPRMVCRATREGSPCTTLLEPAPTPSSFPPN